MADYSSLPNRERADLLFTFGQCDGDLDLAVATYAKKYPTRVHPDGAYILLLRSNITKYGSLDPPSTEESSSKLRPPTRASTRKVKPKATPKATPKPAATPQATPALSKRPRPPVDHDKFVRDYLEAQQEKRRGGTRFWISDEDVPELNKDPRIFIRGRSISVYPGRPSLKEVEELQKELRAPVPSTSSAGQARPSTSAVATGNGTNQKKSAAATNQVNSKPATSQITSKPAIKRKLVRKPERKSRRLAKKSKQ